MRYKIFFLSIFCLSTITTAQQNIVTVEVLQYTEGKYQVRIVLADSLPDSTLLNPKKYKLWENETGKIIPLPEPQLWQMKRGRGVRFAGVNITYKKSYIIQFEDLKAEIQSTNFTLRPDQKGFDEFEGDKPIAWQRSIKPKIAQGDSTINQIGDLGFDLSLSRKLPQKFEFNFDASVTLNKDDPNNHWNLFFFWRPIDLWMPSTRFGFRPFVISLRENATQALKLHDISFSAYTSIFFHPVKGIQPVFLTAGLEEAQRLNVDGKDFDDPRIHVQIQWGMVGLVGKGSNFFIEWRFWKRFENLGDPRIDPLQKKERQYVQLEFILPVAENKNLTLKYADGEVAPTYAKDTSVHLGLEFLFGEQRFLFGK